MAWQFLVTDGLALEGHQILRQAGEVMATQRLTDVDRADALIVRGKSQVTSEVLELGHPKLRVVGRAGTGVDNIDLQSAQALGIVVVNAPLANTTAVAEHALALIFALARDIPSAHASIQRGLWHKMESFGSELSGKTLGLVGMGRIGAALAKRASALEMYVLGHDPFLSDEDVRQRQAEPVSMQALLSQADFISLHVPLNEQTDGLIGREEFGWMKDGARLVNTSRGAIVDETALLEALNDGRLAGAALDVFREEPPGPTPLTQHPAIICTPHIGAQTREAQVRAAVDIANEVIAALRGYPLRWQVV